MTDAEFLRAFDDTTLEPFHHRDHLRVTFLYLRHRPQWGGEISRNDNPGLDPSGRRRAGCRLRSNAGREPRTARQKPVGSLLLFGPA
jgi:hypothetical protein